VLQVAENPLISVSEEERERAILRSRRKFQTDLQSDFATAEDNGERRGRMKRSIEIARMLLKTDLSLEQISAMTGLTYEEVEKLRPKS
jgi:predicted transposase/invertase (TIGR01784 family)